MQKVKLLEDNIRENLHDLSLMMFLDITPKAWSVNEEKSLN